MNTSKRYWPLVDEIKMHVFQWAVDEDFKKLPRCLNAALTTVMNELKIHEAVVKNGGGVDEREQSDLKQDKIKFFMLFKNKYLELTDLAYTDPFNPTDQLMVSRAIEALDQQGANYVDYLTWFLDEWCAIESNKKFLPPQLTFICSSKIRDKFLYLKKDELKMKKKDIESMAMRNLLLQIAIPFLERVKNKDLSAKMVELAEGKISATKFFQLLKAFANKMGDEEAIKQCPEIEKKK